MKDLYWNLNIDRNASEEEVAASLKLRPEMSDYSKILLNPQKRLRYDKAHATLQTIGALRQRLGLDSGDSWFLENHPDFSPRLKRAAAAARAQPDSLQGESAGRATQPGQVAKKVAKRRSRSRVPLSLVVTLIVVIVVTLFLYFF